MIEVGGSRIAQQFYAGRYGEIVASFDRDEVADADVAFVVGALTFVDRVDEAAGLFASWQRRAGTAAARRTIAASRFFLGLAAARAGYFDRASTLLVTQSFRERHDPDPWVRAFVFQGLAAQCYFTGRYPGAARFALRALQEAHEARFSYVAMLATDMRGHSLVQIGQLQRGIAMLEQAGKQARRLGLTNNEFAVETSIATYVTKFDPRPTAFERVEALLRRRAHDSYSRRALLVESAIQSALRGRRTDALTALDDAERDALRGDTRRGKVVSLLARLWVTRLENGPAACRELLEQAVELVEPRDVAFRAQLLGFAVLTARASADREREHAVIAELRALWRQSHHFMAKAALAQFDDTDRSAAFDEDALTPILRVVAHRDASALPRIVSLGLFGLIPELLGLVPARRIILIPSDDLLVLEDHGNVVVRERPPRWCPLLLRVLASGDATKEKIVAGLWGLRAYHPEIHDPPVRTTIHRLRTFLAPYSSWIEVNEGGYRTTVPVHLVSGRELPLEQAPLWEEGEVPTLLEAREPARVRTDVTQDTKQLVLQHLEDRGRVSVPELARALERSASTVLRALRELVDERRIERHGFARATRYSLRAAR